MFQLLIYSIFQIAITYVTLCTSFCIDAAKECSCSCHTLSHGNTTCDTSSCGDSSEAACSSYKKEAPCQGHTALQAPPHCPTGVVGSSDSKMVHTATPLKTGSETESASHDQTTPVEEKKPDVKVPDALPQINISSSPDSNDFKEQKKKPKVYLSRVEHM